MDPVGSHEVGRFDGANDDDLAGVIASSVTHDADAGDGQEYGEDLASRAVKIGGADFLDEDFVGLAKLVQAMRCN